LGQHNQSSGRSLVNRPEEDWFSASGGLTQKKIPAGFARQAGIEVQPSERA